MHAEEVAHVHWLGFVTIQGDNMKMVCMHHFDFLRSSLLIFPRTEHQVPPAVESSANSYCDGPLADAKLTLHFKNLHIHWEK